MRIEAIEVPIRIDEDGVALVGRTDVPIDAVIFAFNMEDSPREIVRQYPELSLAGVYAVIAYYLRSKAEVDAYLTGRKAAGGFSEDMDEDRSLIFSTYQNVKDRVATTGQFGKVVLSIDWARKPPKLFEETIRWALEIEASMLGRELAQQGHEQFPEHEWLAKMANILAPPRLIETGPGTPSLKETMEWVRENASKYSGHWIAVRRGELIGAHESHPDLIHAIGDFARDRETLITRIPS